MYGHGHSSSASITILPIGPWSLRCQILPDSHESLDGNSRIGPFQSEKQYLDENLRVIAERQQRGNLLPLRNCLCLMETRITMTNAYQSCLIPHGIEILALRHRRPPMVYAQFCGSTLSSANSLYDRSIHRKYFNRENRPRSCMRGPWKMGFIWPRLILLKKDTIPNACGLGLQGPQRTHLVARLLRLLRPCCAFVRLMSGNLFGVCPAPCWVSFGKPHAGVRLHSERTRIIGKASPR
jgi:hypothetical protein